MADLTETATCYIRYDPEADAATLGFADTYPPNGMALPLLMRPRQPAALIRPTVDGSFNYLELLGASRAVPPLLSQLAPPASGGRGFHRGTFDLPVTIPENKSYAVLTLTVSEEPDRDIEYATATDDSGETLGRLRRYQGGPTLDVTLFAVGSLIVPILDVIESTR